MDTADAAREFDTLAVMRKLEAAGVGRKQAEAHTEALRESRAGLATKVDLDTGLARLEARLEARIYRALWIQGGAIVGSLTAIAGLSVALAKLFG